MSRHANTGRKLSRNSSHRKSLLQNLVRSVILEESIRTTTPMAILELVEKSEKTEKTEPEKKPASDKKAEEKKTEAAADKKAEKKTEAAAAAQAGEKKPAKAKKTKKDEG